MSSIQMSFIRYKAAVCIAFSSLNLNATPNIGDTTEKVTELSIAGVKNIERPIKYILTTDRLNMALTYSALVQGAITDNAAGGSGELSFTGRWIFIGENYPSRLLQHLGSKGDGRISLKFRLRHRHALLSNSAAALSSNISSILGTTDGFSDKGFEIPDFYFQNVLYNGKVELRYGQLSMEDRIDSHALRSSKKAFLNRLFSTNPSIAYPRFGAGGIVRWQVNDALDLTYALTQVQAGKTGNQVDFNLNSSNLFTAMQAGYNWETSRGFKNRVQATSWAADSTKELRADYGVSAIYELQLKDSNHSFFARYGGSQGIQTDLKHMLAIGYGQAMREKSLLGAAVGAGESSEKKEIQGVLEVFYRHHSKCGIEVTPDIQIQIGRSIPGNYSIILGLRGLIDF